MKYAFTIILLLSVFESFSQVPDTTMFPQQVLIEDVRVTAFETNASIRKVAAAVTVLNGEKLKRITTTSFVPAMNTVPGVKMDERSPGSYRLSIRGNLLRSTFGVRNVKMYWNGIPFTDANGNTYLNQIAFNNIGRIEIIKGPSGSMYGAGTGGVVLMSSTVDDTSKYVSIGLTGGSYGLRAGNAAYVAGTENSSSLITLDHIQSDGYRRQTNHQRDVANYAGTYAINEKQKMSANIFYSDLYYQTPGALTAAEQAADPKQARPRTATLPGAVEQQAALYLKTIYAGFSHQYQFNNRWNNTTGLYTSHTKFKNPTIRNYERRAEQGAGVRSVTNYTNQTLDISAGGEYQFSFNNAATYGNKLGVADTLQYQDEIDNRHFNIFLQATTRIERLSLSGGVSYNNFQYKFLRVSDPGTPRGSSDFEPQFIPRISLNYTFNTQVNFYAAVSKGYSPPSIDEVHASDGIFNKALRAETGDNYEAGLKAGLLNNKLWTEVTYYIYKLQNTIVSRRDASGADFYVNAGSTDQKGLEVALNYVPVYNATGFVRELQFRAAYTNINARFKNYQQGNAIYNGNRLTGTPPNVVSLGADLLFGSGFYLNTNYNYTDAIPLNDANTFMAEHYNLLSGKAGFKTSSQNKIAFDIYITAEKSLNNPYSLGNDLNAAGNRFYNPTAPQQFVVGVITRFKR